jgi:hypothetical protein
VKSEESKKAKGGTSPPCSPRPLRDIHLKSHAVRVQEETFYAKCIFSLSLSLSLWENERKPASSNTSAYIIHGSRLIGGVKGPRALVPWFASNQWCDGGGDRKIPQVAAAAYAGWNSRRGASPRLAVGLPWLKLEPCSPNTRRASGRAERTPIYQNGAGAKCSAR